MDLIYLLIIVLIFLFALEFFIVWRRRKSFSKKNMAFVLSEWESIRGKISREPKNTLIEADKLLDYVLKKKGYSGSLGEKLQKASKIFSHIDNVREAHKLRNRVVHEVGFEVHEQHVRKALSSFKQALWDLGVKF